MEIGGYIKGILKPSLTLDYKIEQVLGSGSYSTVYKAIKDNNEFAIKVRLLATIKANQALVYMLIYIYPLS